MFLSPQLFSSLFFVHATFFFIRTGTKKKDARPSNPFDHRCITLSFVSIKKRIEHWSHIVASNQQTHGYREQKIRWLLDNVNPFVMLLPSKGFIHFLCSLPLNPFPSLHNIPISHTIVGPTTGLYVLLDQDPKKNLYLFFYFKKPRQATKKKYRKPDGM